MGGGGGGRSGPYSGYIKLPNFQLSYCHMMRFLQNNIGYDSGYFRKVYVAEFITFQKKNLDQILHCWLHWWRFRGFFIVHRVY